MPDFRKLFLERLEYYKEDIVSDIGRLVAIPSVRDEKTISNNMPFGVEIKKAFNLIKNIAESFSLKCQDFDGYALHIEYGEADKVLGILTHADVVPSAELSNWHSDPYMLNIRNGFMYGRGVNDDKASIIGVLYIMRILKELHYKPSKKIRLIVGGAEETTWECMNYYLEKSIPPDIAFSPDCDFPVVNCEKGILRGRLFKGMDLQRGSVHNLISVQCLRSYDFVLNHLVVKINTSDYETIQKCAKNASKVSCDGNIATLEYNGIKNLSRNPHRSPHAACGFFEDFFNIQDIDNDWRSILNIIGKWFPEKPFGDALGISCSHEETGELTMALCYISYASEGIEMGFDVRYPAGIEEDYILNRINAEAHADGLSVQIAQKKKRLYMTPDSYLVTRLMDAYEAVTFERPAPVTKGGASYSRAIPNCVGFGPTFIGETPNSHKENECMSIDSLFRALNIYFEAILRL